MGIGLETARKLSTPALYKDYHVIIGALKGEDGDKAVQELKSEDSTRSLSWVELDVTSDDSIKAALDKIQQAFGRLDVLIHNAGVLLDPPTSPEAPRSRFEKTYQVNVFGPTVLTDAAIPLLEKSISPNPRIVFVSSLMGSLATKADTSSPDWYHRFPVYRSSKSALYMVMLHFAQLLREQGWKVNATDPGLIRTAIHKPDPAITYPPMGTVEEGARNCLRLATISPDGETATFSNNEGIAPW
ncbi:hypothetical protein AU210_012533 [Fusarium oxysporum f. sp. radicis-cucumerinum]|uniref:Uncharacterized protein n=3 Tax=Fusarium oxysporum TaxID=5507 RepID=A0A2H3G613_FUSOX|nr:hypothetical protein AU210_012533 [Fusarium oxysporum f. sp. radicis-cucumerinum]RKK10055.1 hypothetical protein BFJ65_g15358 [Fusarium oxysporum f. sp. cepae]RKK81743.1 hypothetical protein BFJ71_g15494 [Fusarium oxysporum]RKK30712.1 hypothetical protein BFJ67_g15609 [Fusarium oxysporum f. sp. cepae]RKK35965.1 hypothetical protein BFJ66_g13709 [Fusarium oxysporum f. sp. cepae]